MGGWESIQYRPEGKTESGPNEKARRLAEETAWAEGGSVQVPDLSGGQWAALQLEHKVCVQNKGWRRMSRERSGLELHRHLYYIKKKKNSKRKARFCATAMCIKCSVCITTFNPDKSIKQNMLRSLVFLIQQLFLGCQLPARHWFRIDPGLRGPDTASIFLQFHLLEQIKH